MVLVLVLGLAVADTGNTSEEATGSAPEEAENPEEE